MPRKLQKSLQDYLNKIKNPTPEFQLPSSSSFPSPKKWISRGCKHPKTLSFAIDHSRNPGHHQDGDSSNKDDAATLSDVDRFLFENFRSLYINNDEEHQENKDKDEDRVPGSKGVLSESPSRFLDPPPNICSSNRFFIAPGSSGSLMEDVQASLTSTSEDHICSSSASTNTLDQSLRSSAGLTNVSLPDDCIAVLAYSPSPYEDFRKSMQDMVEDRLQRKGNVDWDFMEEILFCYLNLNEKRSHKFILSAFVDLIVRLRKTSNGTPPGSRRTRVARQSRKLETAT